ncbi:MAG: hypothetical protein AB1657_00245 [Candidatus Micrarchaeota archaeon]
MAVDFDKFTGKVMDAVRGKLSATDAGILTRLFSRTRKRNVVLAAGLLSALKVGGASRRDIAELAAILEKANGRILEGKEPFTKADEQALGRIFESANVPRGAEERLKHNVKMDQDELLASEIVNSLTATTAERLKGFVPAKKIPSVRFEEEREKERKRVKG